MDVSSISSIGTYRVMAAPGSYLMMAQMINSSDLVARSAGISIYTDIITRMRNIPDYHLGTIIDIYA